MADRARTIAAARGLHERGRQLANTGRPAESQRVLRRALSLLDTLDAAPDTALATALVHKTLVAAAYELGGMRPALDQLEVAAELIGSWGLTSLQSGLHSQRAFVMLRSGLVSDALTELGLAIDDAKAPVEDRCAALLNRAVAHMDTGARAAARADLRACLRLAGEAGLDRFVVKATHNLGYVEFLSGDLPAALAHMDAAFQQDPSLATGTALLGKAEVLVEAGLYRAADDTLAQACDILRRHRAGHDLAEAELERARCALALWDAAAARRFAAAARRRFAGHGNASWSVAAELVELQAELALGRPPRRIARRAAELRDAGTSTDPSAGSSPAPQARRAALLCAEAALVGGAVEAAAAELARAGPPPRAESISGRMQSHHVHARVEAARGDAAGASRRVRRALHELAGYQASFGSIDLRTAAAVHGRHLAEFDVVLALRGGRPAAVFAAAERARAVSSRLPPVRPPADAVTADLLAELRQVIEAQRDERPPHIPTRRRRELEQLITARSWTLAGTGGPTRPAELESVRAVLAERDSTMIVFVRAEEQLSAVVVGRTVRVCRLGAADAVEKLVRRVRADLDLLAHPTLAPGIRDAVRASLRRSLGRLDDGLLVPLGVDGRIVLVSTGVLGQLPWSALPSVTGRPVTVAPSATKWLASTAVGRSGPLRVAALSGPGLVRGDAEAAAVAGLWSAAADADVRTQADGNAFGAALAGVTVLHVAAHGTHQPENPLFSALRLADGPVFAHELDAVAHAPEHVVLSACELGLATVRPGDEALGLASVLVNLGTRSVIAGVARVNDEVAEQTMLAYHRRLAGGVSSAEALARALVEVDSDVPPPFVHFGSAWQAER